MRAPAYVDLSPDGSRLIWSDELPGSPNPQPREVQPEGMLDAFLKVRDGKSAVRFARRYGVLGVCAAHRLPSSHQPVARAPSERGPACDPIRQDGMYFEPLDVWLAFAREAAAILSVAAAVRRGRAGGEVDWQIIRPNAASQELLILSTNQVVARQSLGNEIDQWLALGGVELGFEWFEDHPKLVVRRTPFGELALQLASAVAGKSGVTVCDACQMPYVRERRASQKRLNYCAECRASGKADHTKYIARTRKDGADTDD